MRESPERKGIGCSEEKVREVGRLRDVCGVVTCGCAEVSTERRELPPLPTAARMASFP